MAKAKRKGLVAVVTGASRGAGRGIALGLGEAGATVYVVGRTTRGGPPPADGAPGTIDDTADEVTARGGVGIAARADCTVEAEVAAVFGRVEREQGRVDVLANAVWGAADYRQSMDDWMASWRRPFWERELPLWGPMMDGGPRAYFLASCHAARLMAAGPGGLIVGLTDGLFPGAPTDGSTGGYGGQLVWELSHDCINRLMRHLAREGKKHKIAVVTLMPGFMRTERVEAAMTTEKLKKQFGYDQSESVLYVGRAVAALAADRGVKKKSGTVQFVGELAKEYGFTDEDDRQPPAFNPHAK
jgi:NAD(P)-dependent dehydrogenase (short-subunit alcohol dehydrogenase family)